MSAIGAKIGGSEGPSPGILASVPGIATPGPAISVAAGPAAGITRITSEYERRARELPAGFYSWGNPANFLMHQQAARSCVGLLQRYGMFPLDGLTVADIGCGVGTWLLEFVQWGALPARMAGVDLMPDRIAAARLRLPHADLRQGSASLLPWPDASFDLVSQFVMFTSILEPQLKRRAASEMVRVLKPGGAILWFDFRVDNPWNDQVRGISSSEIRSLFPHCEIELISTMLAPPLSRRVTPWSWPLAEVLSTVPLLRTHYAGLIRKRGGKHLERSAQ